MTAPRPIIASENADRFALLTIKEAADLLHHTVTESALHAARIAGDLWAKKIGKRYYTTQTALMEYLQCPDMQSLPASTSAKTNDNGSFVTAANNGGQDMALASASRLKQLCKNTSQAGNRPSAEVRPIRGI